MTAATATNRPPLWRDIRVIRVVLQVVVVAVVAVVALYLYGNVRTNSESSGIPLSLDYLDQPGDITVPGNDLRQTQSVRDAIVVGFGNTLRVSVVGIVLATLLGTLVGIARLSSNWLLANLARVYVEAVRNVPLLVIVVFSYVAVFLRLPRIEDATTVGSLAIWSIRGIAVPWIDTGGRGLPLGALVLVAAVGAFAVGRWRHAVQDRSGRPARAGLSGVAAAVGVLVVGHLALGSPASLSTPVVDGRRIVGGITMLPEYAALLAALVVYTSSHIAEIVRGSIQAVPKGQFEAASALALSNGQRMRLIVLPQAMRIAVPPLGNQYLNLTKNSSLAVAISYFEMTKVTSVSIGNRAPAVPSFLLLLLLYLAISLAVSAVVNLANRRLAVVER